MDELFERHPQPAVLLRTDGTTLLNRAARALHLDPESVRARRALVRGRDGNGRIVYLEPQRVHLSDGAELVSLQDVTRVQGLEAELAWLKRSDAVAYLTGSLVRELGELLTPMAGLSSSLASAVAEDRRAVSMARELETATALASRLVQRLSAYARPGNAPSAEVDPSVVIAELRPVLELVGGGRVELKMSYGPAGHVQVDRVMLERTLLSLVREARDEMTQGGVIEVSTGRVELEPVAARRLGCPREGPYLTVAVRDEGASRSGDAQRRIFSAARTDGPLAQGYRFVQESGGGLAVESGPGEGTTVILYLPMLAQGGVTDGRGGGDAEEGLPPVTHWPRATAKNRHTLLVVDSDESVREAIRRPLEAAGYVALTAASGRQALQTMARAKVDLVLTEVVLLGMDGVQLARTIAEKDLRAAVMFMSGHGDALLRRYGVPSQCRALLRKPFSPQELARAVRRRLEGDAGGSPCRMTSASGEAQQRAN